MPGAGIRAKPPSWAGDRRGGSDLHHELDTIVTSGKQVDFGESNPVHVLNEVRRVLVHPASETSRLYQVYTGRNGTSHAMEFQPLPGPQASGLRAEKAGDYRRLFQKPAAGGGIRMPVEINMPRFWLTKAQNQRPALMTATSGSLAVASHRSLRSDLGCSGRSPWNLLPTPVR